MQGLSCTMYPANSQASCLTPACTIFVLQTTCVAFDLGVSLCAQVAGPQSMPLYDCLQEPPCQQPHQQAFDFTTGAATGPFIGLKAEPLKLESCSAGGVDSRVSSVGGAAYNPPGAFNLGVQGAAGSVGGAEALRRMSNSRRFSRQGSRMRSRTGRSRCPCALYLGVLSMLSFI